MLPDRVSNPGPLTYESGALPIALRGPAIAKYGRRWAIKTIFLEGVIWVDVQLSQGNFATRN